MATTPAAMRQNVDLTACDREPIHIPGSIQPHGLLLVADAAGLEVTAGAGDLEAEVAPDWLGRTLSDLLRQDIGALMANTSAGPGGTLVGAPFAGSTRRYDVAIHRAAGLILVELEPEPEEPMTAGGALTWLDQMAAGFERTGDLAGLCERAAAAFRALTGFDRVMVYRFLDDEAGRVIGEDRDPSLGAFLHHHFPASDIPKQARALYVRNRARAIPRVDYTPAPLRPARFQDLDLSDIALRSVSPVHLQYLRNMGVEASASISIVKDGVLWGLVACHHRAPRDLPRDVRAAAVALASALARQIRAKEEAELYRERLRLRAAEDALIPHFAGDAPLRRAVASASSDLQKLLGGDGFALVLNDNVDCYGVTPPAAEVLSLAAWARGVNKGDPIATRHLAELVPEAARHAARASGLLALPLLDGGATMLWFRVEQVEEVEWAGNPHKAVNHTPGATLTPRASFESWTQQVRGRSRRWSLEDVESAHRLRRMLHEAHRSAELRTLNRQLEQALADKEALLAHNQVLMREVDHRVQNSLQLVSAFLGLQARDAADPTVAAHLNDAKARLQAVALVHRRLYSDDQAQTVDLSRYLDELAADLKVSLGPDWARDFHLDLAPVLAPADRAMSLGLMMTELVINATKYAYGGASGPIHVTLEQHGDRVRLIVADQGRGKAGQGGGFGSRMLAVLADRVSGALDYLDGEPGLRAVVTAPIQRP